MAVMVYVGVAVHVVVEEDWVCVLQDYVTVLSQLAKASPVQFVPSSSVVHTVPPGCATAIIDSTCQLHVQLKVNTHPLQSFFCVPTICGLQLSSFSIEMTPSPSP